MFLVGLVPADDAKFRQSPSRCYPYLLAYAILLLLQSTAVLTLRSWAFRRRVANTFRTPAMPTARFRFARWVEVAIDYQVNSSFVSTMVHVSLSVLAPIIIALGTGFTLPLFSLIAVPCSLFGLVEGNKEGEEMALQFEAAGELDVHALWETAGAEPGMSYRARHLLANMRAARV